MKKPLIVLLTISTLLFCASCSSQSGASSGNQSDTPSNSQSGNDSQSSQTTDESGVIYTITDYYTEAGELSDLGIALEDVNAEKILTVHTGDTLILGNAQYLVVSESLDLPFYTQPAMDQVIEWWTEHLTGLVDSGDIELKPLMSA